jgi:hypothetical protein
LLTNAVYEKGETILMMMIVATMMIMMMMVMIVTMIVFIDHVVDDDDDYNEYTDDDDDEEDSDRAKKYLKDDRHIRGIEQLDGILALLTSVTYISRCDRFIDRYDRNNGCLYRWISI